MEVIANAGTTIEKERGKARKRWMRMRLGPTMDMAYMSLGTHEEVKLGSSMTSCIFKQLPRLINPITEGYTVFEEAGSIQYRGGRKETAPVSVRLLYRVGLI